jgi:hypothetical protein
MSRKVGQIIARGERRWLVRVYLGRDRETRKRTYHNRTIYGSLRHAQAYLTRRLQCAVKRRWSTAGGEIRPGAGSLHPVAIGAAVEVTKPSEPPV